MQFTVRTTTLHNPFRTIPPEPPNSSSRQVVHQRTKFQCAAASALISVSGKHGSILGGLLHLSAYAFIAWRPPAMRACLPSGTLISVRCRCLHLAARARVPNCRSHTHQVPVRARLCAHCILAPCPERLDLCAFARELSLILYVWVRFSACAVLPSLQAWHTTGNCQCAVRACSSQRTDMPFFSTLVHLCFCCTLVFTQAGLLSSSFL